MKAKLLKKPVTRPGKKKAGRCPPLTNEQLLRLAAKNRPPQSWYDEDANPFEPKR